MVVLAKHVVVRVIKMAGVEEGVLQKLLEEMEELLLTQVTKDLLEE